MATATVASATLPRVRHRGCGSRVFRCPIYASFENWGCRKNVQQGSDYPYNFAVIYCGLQSKIPRVRTQAKSKPKEPKESPAGEGGAEWRGSKFSSDRYRNKAVAFRN